MVLASTAAEALARDLLEYLRELFAVEPNPVHRAAIELGRRFERLLLERHP